MSMISYVCDAVDQGMGILCHNPTERSDVILHLKENGFRVEGVILDMVTNANIYSTDLIVGLHDYYIDCWNRCARDSIFKARGVVDFDYTMINGGSGISVGADEIAELF